MKLPLFFALFVTLFYYGCTPKTPSSGPVVGNRNPFPNTGMTKVDSAPQPIVEQTSQVIQAVSPQVVGEVEEGSVPEESGQTLTIVEKFKMPDRYICPYYTLNNVERNDKIHTITISEATVNIEIRDNLTKLKSKTTLNVEGDWKRSLTEVSQKLEASLGENKIVIASNVNSKEIQYIKIGGTTFRTSALPKRTYNFDRTSQTSSECYHTVKNGENMKLIANKYNIGVAELYNINSLQFGSTIFPNQRLKIK